jgi:uncharacterized 2Fe-2S/4Fe-4S cluster protein (DUF4445 family)
MTEKVKITFAPAGRTIEVKKGTTIMKAAVEAGVELNSICGGKGKCGKCRVIVTGKHETEPSDLIPEEERKVGTVLACLTKALDDLRVFIPDTSSTGKGQILAEVEGGPPLDIDPIGIKIFFHLPHPTLDDNIGDLERLYRAIKDKGLPEASVDLDMLKSMPPILRKADWKVTPSIFNWGCFSRIISLDAGDTSKRSYGIAVDIGTTTIVVYLVDLNSGEVLRTASAYNKQISCGEDVISRIDYAVEERGLSTLQWLVVETINSLIDGICVDVDPNEIHCATLAGNTTMTHLFLGIPPDHIKLEPYIPSMNFPAPFRARDFPLNIQPNAAVVCLPCRSSYVGGDITGDVLASGMHKMDGLFLMIDVGTNGEVVLGNKDWLVGCSCSAGPAFEGGEVLHGIRAAEGAIEKIDIGEDFEAKYSTIGDAKPTGICGSGLIDLISGLLLNNAVDRTGRFRGKPFESTDRIREGEEGKEYVVAWKDETAINSDIFVTEADIRNLIRTKAAVFAACSTLVKSVEQEWEKIDRVFIAGGFGRYLDIRKAISIGLLPDMPIEKFQFIGNGSVNGARRVLLSSDEALQAEEIVHKMTYMELTVSADFMNEFTSALFLPHTDTSLFPSVKIRGL